MSEESEHLAWNISAKEALDFYASHGGEAMTPADHEIYDELVHRTQLAAERHNAARKESREASSD